MGGVEAADDGDPGVTQGLGGVVGLEDQVAGTAAGAEEGGERLVEQGAVTPGCLAHPRLRKFVHLQGHGPGGCGLSVDQ